jgi:glutathione S-transferase
MTILERWLKDREFLASSGYTIADISVFAYVSRADEADIPLDRYPSIAAWVARVRAQARFLDTVHPYSIDPYSINELPCGELS